MLSEHEADEPCALASFEGAYAHRFGPPNDEAFAGHPLADRGLRPFALFEVEQSSWLAYHRPEHFAKYKHYMIAFPNSTFECIAEGIAISIHRGSIWSVVSQAPNEA